MIYKKLFSHQTLAIIRYGFLAAVVPAMLISIIWDMAPELCYNAVLPAELPTMADGTIDQAAAFAIYDVYTGACDRALDTLKNMTTMLVTVTAIVFILVFFTKKPDPQ